MKKYLGIMLAMVMAILPLTVEASSQLKIDAANCADEGDYRTCTVVLNTTEVLPEVKVTLTPAGGAEIVEVNAANGITKGSVNGNEYTFTGTDTVGAGEFDLFTVRYKKSGTADCTVRVSYNGSNVPTPTPTTPDTPTDNKQTGSTLPYVALGGIVLVAVGAYVATRNKAKMYRI